MQRRITMTAFIKLHLQENFKKNAFILFGIIGGLITAIFMSAGTLSFNNTMVNSLYAEYGYQWTLLTILASLAAVALSMNNVEKHRMGPKVQMLEIHGLSKEKKYFGIVYGNILVALTVSLILLIGMIISIFVKQPEVTAIGFIKALLLYGLGLVTTTTLISLFTINMPPAVAALVSIFFVIIGSMRGTLLIIVKNMGGIFGTMMSKILLLVPDINGYGQLARDAFFGESLNYHQLFGHLLYLWILAGILYIIVKGVVQFEK